MCIYICQHSQVFHRLSLSISLFYIYVCVCVCMCVFLSCLSLREALNIPFMTIDCVGRRAWHACCHCHNHMQGPLYANHAIGTVIWDLDRIGSDIASPRDDVGGSIGNWHDAGFGCHTAGFPPSPGSTGPGNHAQAITRTTASDTNILGITA